MNGTGMPRKRSGLAVSHATGGRVTRMMSYCSLKWNNFDLITYISIHISILVANEAERHLVREGWETSESCGWMLNT